MAPDLEPALAAELGIELDSITLRFRGELWSWRGPSPYHFITVPHDESAHLRAMSAVLTYGWGMIPVTARIGGSTWDTSLFPKDGRYVVPIKDLVRKGEGLAEGDTVTLELTLRS